MKIEIPTTGQHPDYRAEIAGILRSSLTPGGMREAIRAYHERDIASTMELLTKEERSRWYSVLPVEALKGQAAAFALSVALCTGAALMVSILLSSVSGTAIPLLFKKLNVDPAVASGPLITTINDLVAVVTYYGLAWIFLLNAV